MVREVPTDAQIAERAALNAAGIVLLPCAKKHPNPLACAVETKAWLLAQAERGGA